MTMTTNSSTVGTSSTNSTTKTAPRTAAKTATKTAAKTAPESGVKEGTGSATRATKTPTHDDKGLRLAALRDLKDVSVREIPDVRGWAVESRDGVVVGKVTRILVDQQQQFLPRYLDVRIDPTRLAMSGETFSTLIPIGSARLVKDRDAVLLPTLAKEQVLTLRPLGDAPIEFGFEMHVARSFGLTMPMISVDDLYRSELFNVSDFVKPRQTAK